MAGIILALLFGVYTGTSNCWRFLSFYFNRGPAFTSLHEGCYHVGPVLGAPDFLDTPV